MTNATFDSSVENEEGCRDMYNEHLAKNQLDLRPAQLVDWMQQGVGYWHSGAVAIEW